MTLKKPTGNSPSNIIPTRIPTKASGSVSCIFFLNSICFIGDHDFLTSPPIHFQFKQISQAYEVLSNPEKKRIYDQGGEQALKEGGMSSGNFSSPMDIFDMFFGGGFGGGRGGRRRERKGQDVIHQLCVSLEELYKGTVRKLALQKNVICDKCEGKTDSAPQVDSSNILDIANFRGPSIRFVLSFPKVT